LRRLVGFCVGVVASLLAACGDDSATGGGASGGSPPTGPVSVQGGVEKGPFVVGSSVLIGLLEADGTPTGQTVSTQTSDDSGAFSAEVPAAALVSIEGQGYYFNELSGDLSDSTLVLRAYADLAGSNHTVYVNVVTHLTNLRIQKLLTEGADIATATAQAEAELRTALGIGPTSFDPSAAGTTMTVLAGDDDANAYLLAVGAVLLEAARVDAGPDGSIEASFQELLNSAAVDFGAVGSLVGIEDTLRLAESSLDADLVMQNLAGRLAELGSNADVPNINRVLDPDEDELANIDDNCPHFANPGQEDEDSDGVGDACECGNGTVDFGELCDDGNDVNSDGCDSNCTPSCEQLGSMDFSLSSYISNYIAIGDYILFFDVNGFAWSVDLTTGETEALMEGTFVDADGARKVADVVYFVAEGGLWSTDGTVLGTELADIPEVYGVVGVLDGQLLLQVGETIALSDGTPAGTTTLASAIASRGVALSDRVVFASAPIGGGHEIWVTDGTVSGTEMLVAVPTFDFPFMPAGVVDDIALFAFDGALWRSDGTAAGTFQLSTANPQLPDTPVASLDGYLYFRANIAGEVFRSDGTLAGTEQLSFIPNGIVLGTANQGVVVYAPGEYLLTDGTAAGTVSLAAVPEPAFPPFGGVTAGGQVFVTTNSSIDDLWVSDGTPSGTHSVIERALLKPSFADGWVYFMRVQSMPQPHYNPWRCQAP
jgi:cysteine-rich repeat protein